MPLPLRQWNRRTAFALSTVEQHRALPFSCFSEPLFFACLSGIYLILISGTRWILFPLPHLYSPTTMITTLPSPETREESPIPVTVPLFRELAGISRSEPRAALNALLWITSLRKPGVFEVVPTENVSRTGVQLITQKSWEPDGMVLVSSPPGLCRQGTVVYCRKLPSDNYVLGIRLSAPVEDWIKTLRFKTP